MARRRRIPARHLRLPTRPRVSAIDSGTAHDGGPSLLSRAGFRSRSSAPRPRRVSGGTCTRDLLIHSQALDLPELQTQWTRGASHPDLRPAGASFTCRHSGPVVPVSPGCPPTLAALELSLQAVTTPARVVRVGRLFRPCHRTSLPRRATGASARSRQAPVPRSGHLCGHPGSRPGQASTVSRMTGLGGYISRARARQHYRRVVVPLKATRRLLAHTGLIPLR